MNKLLMIALLLLSPLVSAQTIAPRTELSLLAVLPNGNIERAGTAQIVQSSDSPHLILLTMDTSAAGGWKFYGSSTFSLQAGPFPVLANGLPSTGNSYPLFEVVGDDTTHIGPLTLPLTIDSGGSVACNTLYYGQTRVPVRRLNTFTGQVDTAVAMIDTGVFYDDSTSNAIEFAFTAAAVCLAPACDAYAAPVIGTINAGFKNIGNVLINTDDDTFDVFLQLDQTQLPPQVGDWTPWRIHFMNVFVGQQAVPSNQGDLMASAFPFLHFPPAGDMSTEHLMEIPLADIGAAAGDTVNVSILVFVSRYTLNEFGEIDAQQTAGGWVKTPLANAVGRNGVNYWWQHQLCDPVTGCVKPAGYYKTHNALSKPQTRDPWPISENTQICGISWLTAMQTKSSDTWYLLAREWIGAMLNVGDGASTPATIDDALIEADTMLRTNCRTLAKKAAGGTYIRGQQLAAQLSMYNDGLLQPAACPVP